MSRDPISPLIHLELRLLALEAQILGPRASYAEPTKPPVGSNFAEKVRKVEDELERLSGQNEHLKRLLREYDGYKPFLSDPSIDASGSSLAIIANDSTGASLVPDSTKLAIVLEAGDDMKAAERDLREIDLLRSKGVDGSGNLEELLPLRTRVASVAKTSQGHAEDLDEARRAVANLLRRYNDYNDTTSELFLELHNKVEEMEAQVTKVEGQRRRAVGETY